MGWRPMSLLLLLLLLPSSSLREVKSLLARRKSAEAVVPLDRVMEQSACAPRETLVSVAVEYPGHPEFRYYPVCVAVLRCSGCCSDEMHECLAVATSKVTLEVFKVSHLRRAGLEQMSFTQHDSCKCGQVVGTAVAAPYARECKRCGKGPRK